MDPRERHDRFVRELNEERAAALVRISRTLESLIAELRASAARIAGLTGPERRAAIDGYAALRKRAELYRWYLEVQREALGLRHHHRLDEFYDIPAPIDPSSPQR